MMDQRPKLVAASQRLQEPIEQCDVIADMEAVRRRVIAFFSKQNNNAYTSSYINDHLADIYFMNASEVISPEKKFKK